MGSAGHPNHEHCAGQGLEEWSGESENDSGTYDVDQGGGDEAHEELLRRIAGQRERASRQPAVVNEAVAEDEHNVAAAADEGERLQLEDLLNATDLDAAARKQLQKLVTKPQVWPSAHFLHTGLQPKPFPPPWRMPLGERVHQASVSAGNRGTASPSDTAAPGTQGSIR